MVTVGEVQDHLLHGHSIEQLVIDYVDGSLGATTSIHDIRWGGDGL